MVATVPRTRKLDPVEIRVLGALLEKEQTTPQSYPLTTNQVIAACNQKTGRDPVTSYTETEVTEALDRLRSDVLVWRSETARAERWEHSLDRRWELDKRSKAVMTLLLLRGPQTPGELRTRSERMHAFESVEEVEDTLQRLAEGDDAVVAELPRQPGQRESRWMHLHRAGADPREAAREATGDRAEPPEAPSAPSPPAPSSRPATASGPATHSAPATARGAAVDPERIDRLEAQVAELGETVDALRRDLQQLRSDLGAD